MRQDISVEVTGHNVAALTVLAKDQIAMVLGAEVWEEVEDRIKTIRVNVRERDEYSVVTAASTIPAVSYKTYTLELEASL